MKRYIACLFFVMATSCSYSDTVVVADLSKDTIFRIQTGVGTPVKMRLEITGEADETVEVDHMLISPGKIHTYMEYDWYSPVTAIHYKPYKAKKGKLFIKFRL